MENGYGNPNPPTQSFAVRNPITTGLVAVVVLILLFSSFTIVGAGHRGVKTTLGAVDPVPLDEGLHLKWFFQAVRDVDVRTVKLSQPADSSSSDLQGVKTVVALNYHVTPSQAAILFQEIGMDYESRIIIPAIQDSLKSVTARYSAEKLITERPDVKSDLEVLIRDRLAVFYITVDTVNFEDFKFSDVFNNAIEAKVTAEQQMLKAEMDLQRIEIEAQQAVALGEAEATVFRLKSQSMSPELVEMERLKVELVKWQKWSGVLPTVMGGNVAPIVDMRSVAAIV